MSANEILTINVETLNRLCKSFLTSVRHEGFDYVPITEGYYWNLEVTEVFTKESPEVPLIAVDFHPNIGDLSFDWDDLQKVHQNPEKFSPICIYLICFGSILRFLGYSIGERLPNRQSHREMKNVIEIPVCELAAICKTLIGSIENKEVILRSKYYIDIKSPALYDATEDLADGSIEVVSLASDWHNISHASQGDLGVCFQNIISLAAILQAVGYEVSGLIDVTK